jgi:two-component system, sensor histidine kinase LadS
VWVDDSGKASAQEASAIFDAQGQTLPVRQEGKSFDLHNKAMWLQFMAHNLSPNARWLLQAELPTTDLITLYYQSADGSWVVQSAGDSLPKSKWALNSPYPLFQLSDVTGQPVQYLLRIQHQRVPYSAAIYVYDQQSLLEARQIENLFLGGYFGISLAVMAMCIASGVALRYANYLRYALYVGVLGLMQLAFLGLWTHYFSPESAQWNSVSSFVMPTWAVVAGLWLVRSIVQPGQFSKRLDAWALLIMAMLCAMALMESFFPSQMGFVISNSLTLIAMLTLYLILAMSARMGDRNARWIALGFAPVVLAGLIPVMRNFGVVSTGFFSQYGVTIGSALEVPLLMYALLRRSSRQRDRLVRDQALQQQDAVTGLADERRFIGRLHSSLLRAKRYRHRLGVLLVHLSNHPHIIKEFGEQMGNTALLLTANHLRNVCRDIDLPARIEGQEFAVVVEGPVSPAQLTQMATHLLAQSLRPDEALPVGMTPKLLIYAAMLPDDQAEDLGEDVNVQYQWLLTQAELAQDESGKKSIRVLNF